MDEMNTATHCEGCDHDVATSTYRATTTDGETFTAQWCDDCATMARVEGDGIASVEASK